MAHLDLDGRRVAYDERGGGAAPPLLCVHGFTGSKEDWAAVIGRLAADRRVVAVDLPGHGGSAGSDDPADYGLGAVAQWVLRFLDAVGMPEAHLCGHSLGGLVVQRTAAAASQRLRSLVLVDTGLGAVREDVAERAAALAAAAAEGGATAAYALASEMGEPGSDPAREAFIEQRFLTLEPAAIVGGASSLITALPLGAFLRGVDLPVLVIGGADDQEWTPREQELLAEATAGAEHAVVPAAAHTPQVENPTAFAAAVGDFLRRADARPVGGLAPPRDGRSRRPSVSQAGPSR